MLDLCHFIAVHKHQGLNDEICRLACLVSLIDVGDDYHSVLGLRTSRRIELEILQVFQCAKSSEREDTSSRLCSAGVQRVLHVWLLRGSTLGRTHASETVQNPALSLPTDSWGAPGSRNAHTWNINSISGACVVPRGEIRLPSPFWRPACRSAPIMHS